MVKTVKRACHGERAPGVYNARCSVLETAQEPHVFVGFSLLVMRLHRDPLSER